jgi:D-alanyl-lipoteichoic acid acyltransferase DltB (MBOAT superfamily)
MLFPTVTFAVFFAVVLTAGWSLHRNRAVWKLVMLAASFVFYGFWDWRFIGLLLLSTVVNQLGAETIHRARSERARSAALVATIVFDLGMLGFFKYYDFFAESMRATIGRIGLPTPPLLGLVLPVAISFFTFQAISYVVDVRRGRLAPAPLIDLALFLSFFPHLVAGPIVRATDFLPQLRTRLDPRRIDLTGAAVLIATGLFKKVVVSSYLAESIVDPVFAAPGRHSSAEVLVATYGYAVQIYADFSGYSDIAIGIALLLGIRFPANFDRPYTAASLAEFWRRWHMTLSSWLRDYVYIPLGGNRAGSERRDRNLVLTMLLGGLWHGAAWTFVLWGAFHGAALVVERRIGERRSITRATARRRELALVGAGPGHDLDRDLGRDLDNGNGADRVDDRHDLDDELATARADDRRRGLSDRGRRRVGRIVTFHVVCLGWLFFRADSVGTALHLLWRLLVGWGPSPLVTPLVLATIGGVLAVQFIPRAATRAALAELSRLPAWAHAVAFGAFLVLVDVLGPAGIAPFIYFQF